MKRARLAWLAVTVCLIPRAAAAYESKCYVRAGDTCSVDLSSPPLGGCGGVDAVHHRWVGPDDEHRQLYAAAAAAVGLPDYLRGAVQLDTFVQNPGGFGADAPVEFAGANKIASRCYGIDEMAQLPDFSYALWDWTSGNMQCPAAGAGVSPADCHDYGAYLGPLNASHFLPQAQAYFRHYHGIALQRAGACAEVRRKLAATPQFFRFVQQCEQEAFTYEAVAEHYLQDAWSTGHMWQRWGSPELSDFPSRSVAVVLALTSGLIHGARGVLQSAFPDYDFPDPLCAPIDPTVYGVPLVTHPVRYRQGSALTPGIGDVYMSLLASSYPQQLASLTACETGAIAEIAVAAGLPSAQLPASALSSSFDQACFSQRVTNESMLLGAGLDFVKDGTQRHIQIDGLVAAGVEFLNIYKQVSPPLSPIESADFAIDLAIVGTTLTLAAALDPDGTDMADGLPDVLGVHPNGAYLPGSAPAHYADPLPPLQISFGGGESDPSNLIARGFHRAHAAEWCALTSTADLATLRVDSTLSPQMAGDKCQICTEIVSRHIRIGEDESHYETASEPLCHYLASSPAYVYQKVDDGDPLHAALIWCGCAENPDGGTDGGDAEAPDGSGTDGSGGAGGNGGNGGTECHGPPSFCDPFGSSPPGPFDSGGSGGGASGTPWNGQEGTNGATTGDPHVITFEGLLYDFQVVGEFVLADDGQGFTVQIRQAPWMGSTSVAGNTAIAARVGAHRVGVYAADAVPLHVDGAAVDLSGNLTLSGDGSVTAKPGQVVVDWSTGERLIVRTFDGHLEARLIVPKSSTRRFTGLLGNNNGNLADELTLRTGSVLRRPASATDLYGRFATSWRITTQESLFDDPAGLGTADFTDLAFPRKGAVSAASLSSSDYAAGLAACTGNGVVAHGLLEACVLDYAVTKEPSVVRGYQGMPSPLAVNSPATYHDDFESGDDGNWQPSTLDQVPASALLAGGRYAGPFVNQALTFTLLDLPDHQALTVGLDLYVMGGWNGDEWRATLSDGTPLFVTSFSNGAAPQAYPDFVGVKEHGAQSAAAAVGALSPFGSGAVDAVYHLRFVLPHDKDSVTIVFQAPALLGATGARWGIDNVDVLPGPLPGGRVEDVLGITIVHGGLGNPAQMGCADGEREALLDINRHPDIAGCLATWQGLADLRTPPPDSHAATESAPAPRPRTPAPPAGTSVGCPAMSASCGGWPPTSATRTVAVSWAPCRAAWPTRAMPRHHPRTDTRARIRGPARKPSAAATPAGRDSTARASSGPDRV